MSQLSAQLKRVLSQIAECQALDQKAAGAASKSGAPAAKGIANPLGDIKEALAKAKEELEQIEVKKVEALRRQRSSTRDLLEVHVEAAEEQFHGREFSVVPRLDYLNQNFSKELSEECVLYLESLRNHSAKAVRILYLMTRPKLAFFLSWRLAVVILIFGFMVAAAFYAGHYVNHPMPGLSRTQTVKAAVARDVTTVKKASQQPDTSAFDRSLKTATAIIDLLPKLPQAILGLTALIAALQRLISPSILLVMKKK